MVTEIPLPNSRSSEQSLYFYIHVKFVSITLTVDSPLKLYPLYHFPLHLDGVVSFKLTYCGESVGLVEKQS